MEIFLDNPGFSVDITNAEVHFSDPPKSSGLSSTNSGDSARRSCKKCHGRMISFSLDKLLYCTKCRGSDCNLMSRCDECMQWTKEEMEAYMKLCRSVSSKCKKSKSSPPRSTPPESDGDHSLAAKLDSVNKSVDMKIEAMSASLMSRFSSMLEKFQLSSNNPSLSDPSAVPGYSACLSEPPSRHPTVSTKNRKGLRFRKGDEDPVPHEDELASASIMDETPETVWHPPGDTGEPQGSQRAPVFARQHQADAGFDSQVEDDDDDDRESVADIVPPNKAYNSLMHYIYDRFPHSRPTSAPHLPPRCEFEEFFATSEVTSSTKPNLVIYSRVSEIVEASTDRASRFARESRPLHRVVPLRRLMFHVGDQPDYCSAKFLNPDFSRISKHKTILKSRSSSDSLSDLERLDLASCTILAGESQSFWLLSSLLAQLRNEGYKPADPALFDKNISTLSAALASQTTLSAGLSDFITSKRRESYLAHTSCPIVESVKSDLLVAPGSNSLLFNQRLLEKVVSTVKEDPLSHLRLRWPLFQKWFLGDGLEPLALVPALPLCIFLALALKATESAPLLHLVARLTSVGVRVGA